MDSSGSPGKPVSSPNRWSDAIGTAIALLTLTIPLLIIGYYSAAPAASDFSPDLLLYRSSPPSAPDN